MAHWETFIWNMKLNIYQYLVHYIVLINSYFPTCKDYIFCNRHNPVCKPCDSVYSMNHIIYTFSWWFCFISVLSPSLSMDSVVSYECVETHRDQVTKICARKQKAKKHSKNQPKLSCVQIYNGLSPVLHKAITGTDIDLLLNEPSNNILLDIQLK